MKFIQTHGLKLVQIVHLQIRMSCSSWHSGWHSGCLKRQTYQIQYRLYNIPVANLSHLDQAGKNCEFHFDIPYWNRWIHNPNREDHWTWAARHRRLGGGSSRGCSGVLPMTRSGLSVRERHLDRHRHRSLAWHFQAKRTASDVPPARNSVNALKRPKQGEKNRIINPVKTTKGRKEASR